MTEFSHIPDDKEQDIFADLEVNYSKSKDDIWSEMNHAIDESSPSNEPKIIKMSWLKYAAAISILLIGSLTFMRFYSVEFNTENGEFATHLLPDGSEIEMNAGSTISYLPYWWNFSREVTLEGEAFFKVEKGSQFSVHSTNGTTQVLGTSFNIYTRANAYKVYCKTGKVKVTDKNNKHVLLQPGDFASITNNQLKTTNIAESEAISWTLNEFVYNTTPLTKVLQDFERQYNVEINPKSEKINQLYYTGIFDRSITAEDAIQLVCLSFDLSVEKTDKFTFTIY